MHKIILHKKQWGFILIIWLTVQAFYLYTTGIVITGESEKYINLSAQLAAGDWKMQPNFYLYAGYILIHLTIKIIGLSYKWMYLVQLAVAAIAFICFIKILTISVTNRATVVTTAVLFAICPFFQSWNCFLYTDSMFASLIIISIYCLLVSSSPAGNHKKVLVFLLLAVPFFRPIGLLFIPVAIFFWVTDALKKHLSHILFFSGYFVLLLLFSWYCLNHSNDFFYPNHNSEANIICGYPSDLTKYIKYPYEPDKTMFHFFIANPEMSARLLMHRLYKSFWMTRPYFSTLHNTFIILFLIPCYTLALIGTGVILRSRSLKNVYILFGLSIFILPMLAFCADWSNRFMLPPLVFIFILMATGLEAILKKMAVPKPYGS